MENDQSQPSQIPGSAASSGPDSAPQTDIAELQAKYDSLHHLVVSVLLLLIVVSGTFWIFLMRQVRTAGADLDAFRPQATNLIAQYKKNEPALNDLLKKFQEFGRTNSDFGPYLAKYGITPNTAIGAAPTNPAGGPAPAKKK